MYLKSVVCKIRKDEKVCVQISSWAGFMLISLYAAFYYPASGTKGYVI